ncbi:MAG: hypothetical protein KDC42_03870 [Ignavibacteriae bacterium]|nr:hypothetical protein [Ignavibacteriota bacterium]
METKLQQTNKRIIDKSTLNFLKKIYLLNLDFKGLFPDPEKYAKRNGLKISKNITTRLKVLGQLNKQFLSKKEDSSRDEIISLFNNVIIDGRYIKNFVEDPIGTARKLNFKLSKSAKDYVLNINIKDLIDLNILKGAGSGQVAFIPIAIVIVIVLVFIPSCSIKHVVVDNSQKTKF